VSVLAEFFKGSETQMGVFAPGAGYAYVWVNGKGQRPFGAPFGGWKLSGLGEENSLGELLSYTRTKNVNLSGLTRSR